MLQHVRSGGLDVTRSYADQVALGQTWVRSLRTGDNIFVSSAAGEPQALIDTLISGDATLPTELTVHQLSQGGAMRLVTTASPERRMVGIAGNSAIADLAARDAGSYRLSTIGQTAAAIRDGAIVFDVALIQVAPSAADGQCSLGIAVDFARDAIRRARLVVAQVNSSMPYTHGDALISLESIDAIVELDQDLPFHPTTEPDERAAAIAQHVATFVPQGGTIEIGVGAVPTAILSALSDHHDLGLHTGLFVGPMISLIECGAITNRHGTLRGNVSVANQATADPEVTAFLHDNRRVAMMPASYTHDPAVLRSQHRLRAINSAIEVDLLGRVNSEFVAGQRVTTAGGLLDFVRAAVEHPDGRSIIALRATTATSARSKIVSRLSTTGTCTIEADLADLVITEHGVADLTNQPLHERVERMIAVAEPEYRDQLAEEARTLYG